MKTLIVTFLLAQVVICAALLFPEVAAARIPEPPPLRHHARSHLHRQNPAVLRTVTRSVAIARVSVRSGRVVD